jgi:hypothetical protein
MSKRISNVSYDIHVVLRCFVYSAQCASKLDFSRERAQRAVVFSQAAPECLIAPRKIETVETATVATGATVLATAAHHTLATLKASDTPDTLMMRVVGSRMVAAE